MTEIDFNKEVERIKKNPPEELQQIKRQMVQKGLLIDSTDKEAAELLKDPKLFKRITINEFDKKIEGEIENRQTIFLNACGMYVENHAVSSYNLCIDSTSGAGKDYVVKNVTEIFPQNKVVGRTRISPTVFNYWHNSRFEPEWTWNGKICYLLDISNNILNHEVFKVMVSDGSAATITINNRAVDIEVKGKPVMLVTTANASPNSEMLRRFPILNLTETTDQTRAIMKREAIAAQKGVILQYDPKVSHALSKLNRVKVKVLFAEKLVNHFPPDHIIMRTHFNRLLDLIKASAALYQYQRELDDDGYILAEPEDYERARIAIVQTTANKLMITLTKRQKEFLELCTKLCNKHDWISIKYDILPNVDFDDEGYLSRVLRRLSDFFETNTIKATEFFGDRQDLGVTHDQAAKIYKPLKIVRVKNYGVIKIPTYEEINAEKRQDRQDSQDSQNIQDIQNRKDTNREKGILTKLSLNSCHNERLEWDDKAIVWHYCVYPIGDDKQCGDSPCNEFDGMYYCKKHFAEIQKKERAVEEVVEDVI